MYNGFVSWEGSLISEAQYIANQISSTIRAAFNSHSPSRVMMAIGEDVGEGLAIGIKDSGMLAVEAADDVAYDIIDTSAHYDYKNIRPGQDSGNKDYMQQVISLLKELRNLQVVMDSGELVGIMSPGINNEFERMKIMQERS